jgi:hypothetical protein
LQIRHFHDNQEILFSTCRLRTSCQKHCHWKLKHKKAPLFNHWQTTLFLQLSRNSGLQKKSTGYIAI